MNILKESGYALRNLWSIIKNKINRVNLIYMIIPFIYILIILLVAPRENVVYSKDVIYASLDSYQQVTITNEDKIKYILKEYNLSKEQFKVLCGVVLSEAANTYEDAYAVINTIYNRAHSKNWVRSVDGHFGKGKGKSMYYQVISPGQFTVYKSGSYKRYMNNTTRVGYQAIIDFLYTKEIMHNYLSFRSHSIKVSGSVSFSKNGNNYFGILKEENRI